ncbi:MAG: hypothetical protein QXT43_02495, partial [Candidatus Micrarchaeaceae archaeon]
MQAIFLDYAVALALIAYAAFSSKKRFLAALFIAAALAFAVASAEHASAPLLVSGTIIMASFVKNIGNRINFAMLPLALLYFFSAAQPGAVVAQALLFGMLA